VTLDSDMEFIDDLYAKLDEHAEHTWKQVDPCVYCVTCSPSVRLYQGTIPAWHTNVAPEDDFAEEWWDQRALELDDGIVTECPVCHAVGACGYDDEGRALIHALSVDEAAESAVEEAVR